jgi:hypothetical protein
MTFVFVLDSDRQPLDPCHPARARQLLHRGRAAVLRRYPFTIILHDRKREDSVVHAHRLKIDPGSHTTGLALLRGSHILWAAELTHRGQRIQAALERRRTRQRLPKAHWTDAACVGASTPETLCISGIQPLGIRAIGHGTRQICRTDKHGFPVQHRTRQKRYFGMQTGDLVKAVVPRGKYQGVWISRVVVKASGWFDLIIRGKKASVHQKHCVRLWAADGYTYTLPAVAGTAVSPLPLRGQRAPSLTGALPPAAARGLHGGLFRRRY